jgi:hypothetical protein
VNAPILALFPGLIVATSRLCADAPGIPAVPKTFLQTDHPAWQRILAKPVRKADFRETPLHHAIRFLFRDSDANFVLRAEQSNPASPSPSAAPAATVSALTLTIPEVPLRTALFMIAQKTGATISWEMRERGKILTAIQITYK